MQFTIDFSSNFPFHNILDKKDYIFRSFWDRDDCFRMLTLFHEKFRSGSSISRHLLSSSATLSNDLGSSIHTVNSSNGSTSTTTAPAAPNNEDYTSVRAQRRASTIASENNSEQDVIDTGTFFFARSPRYLSGESH